MIIVALVATLAASMVWQQWRAIQVEAAERARTQSAWILAGALDWARLILREDAQDGRHDGTSVDHLGEPWAVPLAEARLSTFLAADKAEHRRRARRLPVRRDHRCAGALQPHQPVVDTATRRSGRAGGAAAAVRDRRRARPTWPRASRPACATPSPPPRRRRRLGGGERTAVELPARRRRIRR